MARSAAAKKQPPKPKSPFAGAQMIGEEADIELRLVRPNDWNPNEMTDDEYEGLKHGMKERGWLRSQKLLVWGKDEKGKVQNVIIDGEHRWEAATEVGIKVGPAVFLHGLTRLQAKALTIEIDRKRGRFNPEQLGVLVREVQHAFPPETLARDLGFTQEEILRLIAEPEVKLKGEDVEGNEKGGVAGKVVSENPHVKVIQLQFPAAKYDAFIAKVTKLSKRYGVDTVSDTVERAVMDTK